MKRAVFMALGSAALFGASAPLCKPLLGSLSPLFFAGLLYLGAAAIAIPFALVTRGTQPGPTSRTNRLRLAGGVLTGGVLGPVFLLLGLRAAPAASVSLWLTLELVATAILAALFFGERLRAAGIGAVLLALAGAALVASGTGQAGLGAGSLVAAACTCWALDNNLTALVRGWTPAAITLLKGVAAGSVNLCLGLALEPLHGAPADWVRALAIGAVSYGLSLVLYVGALQGMGAVRTQVVFASAPLFGLAIAAIAYGEPVPVTTLLSLPLSAAAVGLLVLERHEHPRQGR